MLPNDISIYHEKQSKELCALHALNNLFQSKEAFKQMELDAICFSLSPNNYINPHRSILGLGNYDVNVIIAALQNKGYNAIWFDKRKDPKSLKLDQIFGFVMNIPSECRLGFLWLPLKRRHWISIKNIGGTYFNLDSKLSHPSQIGNESDLLNYFKDQLYINDNQLFIVVSKDNNNWISLDEN
ncbi:josephin-like protein [Daktulosphaira vitifoliae]|uniref:josephin-like protein n=1 Tax=Daktulosphaira vitifoliae TaxID=58002 RepID=UPI0021AAB992|nr:josephin-like protein [Daktulosphaira vitifoliae]